MHSNCVIQVLLSKLQNLNRALSKYIAQHISTQQMYTILNRFSFWNLADLAFWNLADLANLQNIVFYNEKIHIPGTQLQMWT